MANARSIINKACRKIHVLGRGQTLSAEEAFDALETLNDMLGTFSAQGGLIFNNVRETFTLTGAQSYTIGSGGTFSTSSPIVITSMFVTIGSLDYPLKQITAEEYAAKGFKGITGLPDEVYFEDNTPLGRLFFYPVVTSGTLNIWSRKALTEFADLTTDYDTPRGMEELLWSNLAVRLAPDYETEASRDVKRIARDSMRALEAATKRNNYPKSQIDIASGGSTGNIFSGWYPK